MIPSVITLLPNSPWIVGTYDLDQFESWWVVEPFDRPVAEVLSFGFVYGQTFFLLARMEDGSTVVLGSPDGCRSFPNLVWEPEVEILAMLPLDPGWVLFQCEDGWYETQDTGVTITKTCDGGPAGGAAKVVGMDERHLIVHTGTELWLSEDEGEGLARSWRRVYDGSWWGGETSPVLVGNELHLWASIGPAWLWSGDGGETWAEVYRHKNTRIIRNAISLDDGTPPSVFVQTEDQVTSTFRFYVVTEGGEQWTARYDRNIAPRENLAGFNVQVPIFGGTEKLYFNGGSKFDPALGRFVPSLMYSRDGVSWSKINLENTHTSPSSPFLVEQWTIKIMVPGRCHNWYWADGPTVRRWGLSFELAVDFMHREIEAPADLNALVSLRRTETADVSAWARQTFSAATPVSLRAMKTREASVGSKARILKTIDETADVSASVVLRQIEPLDLSGRFKKQIPGEFWVSWRGRKHITVGFGLGIVMVKSYYDQILVDTESYFPQFWNFHCPEWPWFVFDSRKDVIY